MKRGFEKTKLESISDPFVFLCDECSGRLQKSSAFFLPNDLITLQNLIVDVEAPKYVYIRYLKSPL